MVHLTKKICLVFFSGNNILDVRKAFDKKPEADLVSYDVDLSNNDEDEEDDEDVEDVADGGKLLAAEDYPIVGRDFDLATKLIRL